MSALSPHLATRIGKLIGRLGSDHDGEVVATGRAIVRILKGEGRDLQDLAQHVATKPAVVYRERPSQQAGPTDYGDWRFTFRDLNPRRRHKAQISRLRAAPPGFLSAWEASFTASVAAQLELGRSLSARQAAILGDLLTRLGGHHG